MASGFHLTFFHHSFSHINQYCCVESIVDSLLDLLTLLLHSSFFLHEFGSFYWMFHFLSLLFYLMCHLGEKINNVTCLKNTQLVPMIFKDLLTRPDLTTSLNCFGYSILKIEHLHCLKSFFSQLSTALVPESNLFSSMV